MKLFETLSGKKKSLLLVLIGVLGVVLILFGTSHEKKTGRETEKDENTPSTLEYITDIENKIGNITEEITGSRRVRVVASVSSGSRFLYIRNDEEKENAASKEYVTVRIDGGEAPVLEQEIYPELVGVSVACKGGDDPEIQAKLIRMIATAYGLSTNRICIVGIP